MQLLTLLDFAAFAWFLYEIIRLEGWPGRKWHHAYLAVPLVVGSFFVSVWIAFLLLSVAFLLIWDDAAQHRIHNRLKRQGVPMNQWPVSWLHRYYEKAYRELTD